jgi:hypothetical protein
MEDTEQIDVHDGPEGLGVDPQRRAEGADGRVGHHNVDTAEALDPLVDSGLYGRQVAYVGDSRHHAILTQIGPDPCKRALIDVDQHQLRAPGVQLTGHLGTQAVPTARDQRDLSHNRVHTPCVLRSAGRPATTCRTAEHPRSRAFPGSGCGADHHQVSGPSPGNPTSASPLI